MGALCFYGIREDFFFVVGSGPFTLSLASKCRAVSTFGEPKNEDLARTGLQPADNSLVKESYRAESVSAQTSGFRFLVEYVCGGSGSRFRQQ